MRFALICKVNHVLHIGNDVQVYPDKTATIGVSFRDIPYFKKTTHCVTRAECDNRKIKYVIRHSPCFQ